MTQQRTVSAWLTGLALVLTIAVMLATLAGQFRLGSSAERPLDVLVFATLWSYILVTPVAAVSAVALGDRGSWWTRTSFGIAALWLAFIVWTMTLTL